MPRPRSPLPGPEYHVRAEFRAPILFVFRWCTDFRPNDDRLEGETYERRVIRRTPRRVIFEDLSDAGNGGWSWVRHDVALDPPRGWHSESLGSHRAASIDYRLSELGPERTRLDLVWRRRPTRLAGRSPPKARIERETTRSWRHFAHALERDYRRASARRSRRRTTLRR